MDSTLPVVVIGAGSQGLAAAAHLTERGIPFVILEAGAVPAAAVEEWSHVRLFSGWSELVDAAGSRLLASTGWSPPAGGPPTGREWIDGYLAPLAALLREQIRYGNRVAGVSRRGRDRSVDAERGEQPFAVHVRTDAGERLIFARAVIDAAGVWSMPAPAGADGLPAIGEGGVADLLSYRIPDFRDGADAARGHVLVIGSGHSAVTAVLALSELARRDPYLSVGWIIRRSKTDRAFGGGDADEIAARGALGTRARDAVDAGLVALVRGFRVERMAREDGRLTLTAEDGRTVTGDRAIVLTGFRPDLSFLSEMRLDLDAALQAPRRIAAEIDPNVHSCGSVAATGAVDLAHPEPGLFLVGAKSYGRAPTFLALTGYEQVRSVVAELAGDHEAARRVELALPATGVCGGLGEFDLPAAGGDGCCGSPAPLLRIGTAPGSTR